MDNVGICMAIHGSTEAGPSRHAEGIPRAGVKHTAAAKRTDGAAEMTRAEQIRDLQVRYLLAVSQHKRKTAALIFARMKSLMTRQLAYENKIDRRKAA